MRGALAVAAAVELNWTQATRERERERVVVVGGRSGGDAGLAGWGPPERRRVGPGCFFSFFFSFFVFFWL